MIEVAHLRKEFGEILAVDDVSFQVRNGEVLGFLGPNAAGKTTTMRMLTGYLPATSGRARIADFDILEHPLEARRHIGYLPENVPLYEEMPVGQYLAFMAKMRDIPARQIRSRVEAAMGAVRIKDREHQAIRKLSRGLRQRVGLAQALLHDPRVLILDEPTVGLDPRQVIEVRDLIRSLRREHTIILSTHILAEASMVCDRIIIIHEGRIIAEDRTEALTARLLKGQKLEIVARGPRGEIRQALLSVPGIESVEIREEIRGEDLAAAEDAAIYTVQARGGEEIRESAAAAIVSRGHGLRGLQEISLTLEEIFLRMTAAAAQTPPSPDEADPMQLTAATAVGLGHGSFPGGSGR